MGQGAHQRYRQGHRRFRSGHYPQLRWHLPFPAPTEERRRELVKECREYAEQAKVSIRNIRRDFNNKLERDEELTEDDVRREQAKVQKHTDEYVAKVEELLKEKEAEVMEI